MPPLPPEKYIAYVDEYGKVVIGEVIGQKMLPAGIHYLVKRPEQQAIFVIGSDVRAWDDDLDRLRKWVAG